MKKISYLFALLASVIAFNACTSDVDNYFDETAQERAAKSIANVKDVLQAAPNGWRMEYYGNLTYGGFNVLCKFTGDSVVMASEKAGANHEAGFDDDGNLIMSSSASHFTLDQSMGVVLSFDTYNGVFHYFSEPKNEDYGEAGYGFNGDFEFRVLSASADSIILQGRKHGDHIKMYPMASDLSWADYLKQVEETKTWMAASSYTLQGTRLNQIVYAQQYGNYHNLVFQYYQKDSVNATDSTLQTLEKPFVVTPEGYKFYEPVTILGNTFDNLAKGDTDERFYPKGDNSIWLETVLPSVVDAFKIGQWFFAYSQVGEYAQSAWDDFKEALQHASNDGTEAKLYWAMIGQYSGKFGFHAYAGSDYIYVELTVRDPNEEGNEMALQYNRNSPTNKAAQVYMKSHKLTPVLKTFSALNNKFRLKLETDNPRKPTYMKLIDAEDETHVLNLSATTINYPFDR